VSGSDLVFDLESSDDVTICIYDAYDELVRTIAVSAENTAGGENSVHWDALADSGYKVADGMYYYTVKTDDGFVDTPVTEEVSGIKYMNGSQYLVLGDSGRLVSVSNVTQVN
jgi:flagellar basal-body rod modification protein FlgD